MNKQIVARRQARLGNSHAPVEETHQALPRQPWARKDVRLQMLATHCCVPRGKLLLGVRANDDPPAPCTEGLLSVRPRQACPWAIHSCPLPLTVVLQDEILLLQARMSARRLAKQQLGRCYPEKASNSPDLQQHQQDVEHRVEQRVEQCEEKLNEEISRRLSASENELHRKLTEV